MLYVVPNELCVKVLSFTTWGARVGYGDWQSHGSRPVLSKISKNGTAKKNQDGSNDRDFLTKT